MKREKDTRVRKKKKEVMQKWNYARKDVKTTRKRFVKMFEKREERKEGKREKKRTKREVSEKKKAWTTENNERKKKTGLRRWEYVR